MFSLFFGVDTVDDFDTVMRSDPDIYRKFFHKMLDAGVYLAPSAYEVAFLSAAHDDATTEATLRAAEQAFISIRESR